MSRSAQNFDHVGAVFEICIVSEVSGYPLRQALLICRLRAQSCREHPRLSRHYWLYLYLDLVVGLQAGYRAGFGLHLVTDGDFLQITLPQWLVAGILIVGLLQIISHRLFDRIDV
jgi:hypothetical protein